MDASDLSSMSDEDFGVLRGLVQAEEGRREKLGRPAARAALSRRMKRDLRCPYCSGRAVRDGRSGNGNPAYLCTACGRRFTDTAGSGLSASKLPAGTVRRAVALVLCGCPDWVISLVLGVNVKTAQFWRDRCLDAAVSWAQGNVLSGHVWIDEMAVAPVRAEGLRTVRTYSGHVARTYYLEVAVDGGGPGTETYESKMRRVNSACSYVRYGLETHRGIKAAKLEAYADLFLYRWCSVRRRGFRTTADCLFSRVVATEKSHKQRDSASEALRWS
jgi:transposase-like protein